MSCCSCWGMSCARSQPLISAPPRASAVTSATSRPCRRPATRWSSPPCARTSRYARAVVANPPGTRTPAPPSWLIISPSEAFLPPTSATSFMRKVAKSRTRLVLLTAAVAEFNCASREKKLFYRQITLQAARMAHPRTAFFVSDRTGITAEMLGHSLLTQFDGVRFNEVTLPFVDTVEKAREVVDRINQQGATDGERPIVISTLARTEIAQVLGEAHALFLDCFEIFISPLERELGLQASHIIGRSHSISDLVNYHHRLESVNYTLAHDDGVSNRDLPDADVILVGVSRCGKTPTCLYLP